jgi:formylglycine-generating enzyme required for sulfatase activity
MKSISKVFLIIITVMVIGLMAAGCGSPAGGNPGHKHTPSGWIIDVQATEEKEGSRHKECTGCGDVLETDTIPRLLPSIVSDTVGKLTLIDQEDFGKKTMGTGTDAKEVTLDPFYMSEYEVTQAQWKAVMGGNNPSYYTGDDNRPVERVSWYDVLVFCNKLTMKEIAEGEALTPVYSINGSTDPDDWGSVPTDYNAAWDAVICDWDANGYRLPTEAEWEYACWAGAATEPRNMDQAFADAVAWYNPDAGDKTHAVGEKLPNAFELYDMYGNVWEWCWDWFYDQNGFTTHPSSNDNPRGTSSSSSSGISHVARGGSYYDGYTDMYSARRNGNSPFARGRNFGFRLVRPLVNN